MVGVSKLATSARTVSAFRLTKCECQKGYDNEGDYYKKIRCHFLLLAFLVVRLTTILDSYRNALLITSMFSISFNKQLTEDAKLSCFDNSR